MVSLQKEVTRLEKNNEEQSKEIFVLNDKIGQLAKELSSANKKLKKLLMNKRENTQEPMLNNTNDQNNSKKIIQSNTDINQQIKNYPKQQTTISPELYYNYTPKGMIQKYYNNY